MEKTKTSSHRQMIVSLLYVLFAFIMLISVTYAWFTITDRNQAHLIQAVSGVEAEYKYYVYNDASHSGSQELTLINNVTTSGEDLAYELIPNPTVAHLINGYIAPGERFSFAIQITNVGTDMGYLSLSFTNIISTGYDRFENRIQNALYYEVTKIVHTDEIIESADIKDDVPTAYWQDYFDDDQYDYYDMVKNVPLGYQANDSITIIFFDIVFDPTIHGIDNNDDPYTNSNIFQGQTVTINQIYMEISPSLEEL